MDSELAGFAILYKLAPLPAWLLSTTLVFIALGISAALVITVRKIWPRPPLEGVEVRAASAIFSVLGALLSLLLAFVVVTVWQNFEEQKRRTVREAVELANLYRDAGSLDESSMKHIRTLVTIYTQAIINDSFGLNNGEGQESKKSAIAFNKLYDAVMHQDPRDSREEIVVSGMMRTIHEVAAFRRLRVLSGTSGLPRPFWTVLIVGAFAVLMFSSVFRIGAIRTQFLLTGLLAGFFALILSLVILLMYPYRSSIGISVRPFERLLTEVFPQVLE